MHIRKCRKTMSEFIPLFEEVEAEIRRTDDKTPAYADIDDIEDTIDWILKVDVGGWRVGLDRQRIERIDEEA